MSFSCQLDLYPDVTVTCSLYRDVENPLQVHKALLAGTLPAALIRPGLVCDLFQVLVAVNKAVHLSRTGARLTRTLYTEVVFCLSPSRNIAQSLKKFGFGPDDHSVLAVSVTDQSAPDASAVTVAKVGEVIRGCQVPISYSPVVAGSSSSSPCGWNPWADCDWDALTIEYGLPGMGKCPKSPEDLASALDAIVGKIACKNLVVV